MKNIVYAGLLPLASFACVSLADAQPTGTNSPPGGAILSPGTVSQLPTCNAGATGTRGFVSDNATATTWLGAVTAGGTSAGPVICNGVSWRQD